MSFALNADKKLELSVSGKDEVGNPTTFTGTPAYAVDNTDVLVLTDNGDGSANVAATGTLGVATVTVSDTETSGQEFVGSLAIDVVAGDVAVVEIVPGEVSEVTPDV